MHRSHASTNVGHVEMIGYNANHDVCAWPPRIEQTTDFAPPAPVGAIIDSSYQGGPPGAPTTTAWEGHSAATTIQRPTLQPRAEQVVVHAHSAPGWSCQGSQTFLTPATPQPGPSTASEEQWQTIDGMGIAGTALGNGIPVLLGTWIVEVPGMERTYDHIMRVQDMLSNRRGVLHLLCSAVDSADASQLCCWNSRFQK
ncbi:hypothetical protein K488DRAFT_82709 [Vararia minispora EC-137]|uniref:Uncharacterized protein n=1 Tax=Vararia minispora EC-137 TaxID=1314806 RepID=A0ACB8QVG8_9AGAM|nr:hypothetical protein K488DRAFT_82709 [Vararia minispora EC-137]